MHMTFGFCCIYTCYWQILLPQCERRQTLQTCGLWYHYGCNEDGTIQWIKETFPNVVTELLTQEKDDDGEEDEEG